MDEPIPSDGGMRYKRTSDRITLLIVADIPYPEAVNGISIYLKGCIEELVRMGCRVIQFSQKGLQLSGGETARLKKTNDSYRYTSYQYGPSSIIYKNAIENPLPGIHDRDTEIAFETVLARHRPEIVHFHEFVRTPVKMIDLAKHYGSKVFVTLHDYWLICPKLLMMKPDATVCQGMEGGKRCVVHCLGSNVIVRSYRYLVNRIQNPFVLNAFEAGRWFIKRVQGGSARQLEPGAAPKPELKNLTNEKVLGRLGLRQRMMMDALNRSDMIIAVSNAVMRIFSENGLNEEKAIVMPLGVTDCDKITWRLRQVNSPPVRFGFLGHLGPCKGAQVIWDALETIPTEKARFLFWGGGDRYEVDLLRKKCSLNHNVEYFGRYSRNQLTEIIKRFDILIMPSIWEEPLGLTALEAMCGGIPVIGSEIGGIQDYVHHGMNGILVPPGDSKALAGVINRIIAHPEMVSQLSRGTRDVPTPIKRHAAALHELYVQTIEATGEDNDCARQRDIS